MRSDILLLNSIILSQRAIYFKMTRTNDVHLVFYYKTIVYNLPRQMKIKPNMLSAILHAIQFA